MQATLKAPTIFWLQDISFKSLQGNLEKQYHKTASQDWWVEPKKAGIAKSLERLMGAA